MRINQSVQIQQGGGFRHSILNQHLSYFFQVMLPKDESGAGQFTHVRDISAGVDSAVYEPDTGLVFCSTREGMVHIFHEDTPDKYSVVETIKRNLEPRRWRWIQKPTIEIKPLDSTLTNSFIFRILTSPII